MSDAMTKTRFTLDGSGELEAHLARVCRRVENGIREIVPARKLEAILLGGGYGRGEGGVLKTPTGDQPYNDLEFYIFIRGSAIMSERRFQDSLNAFAEKLSPEAKLHVEFKIYSVEKLRNETITMFTHDLMTGHKMVFGHKKDFAWCHHHLHADKIPISEATRLLFNRCSGLLLAKEILQREIISVDEADFVGRNLAKAQLAFGDAVLTVHRKYHWSCRERHKRLLALRDNACPLISEVRAHHETGMNFKLHPQKTLATAEELERRLQEISGLGLQLWLSIENLRLSQSFSSARDYALSTVRKCSGTSRLQNYFLNWRTFGLRGVLGDFAGRYPRERLFNALALLLWDKDSLHDFEIKRRLRAQLQTKLCDWVELVGAYKTVWPSYG